MATKNHLKIIKEKLDFYNKPFVDNIFLKKILEK